MKEDFRTLAKKLNEALSPYYSLLMMIGFFIAIIWSGIKFIVRNPELEVFITREEVNFPSKINKDYLEVYKYISENIQEEELRNQSANIYNYLVQTRDFLKIELNNTTNRKIEDIELRLTNVKNMTATGVAASFLLDEEMGNVLEGLIFKESSGILYMNKLIDLPPQKEFTVYLWGDFLPYFLEENIIVSYKGGMGQIVKKIEVKGFKAYLVDFYIEVFLILIFLFFIIYRYLIIKYTTNETNS